MHRKYNHKVAYAMPQDLELVMAADDLRNIKTMIKIANRLDERGLFSEADALDNVIIALAQQSWRDYLSQGAKSVGDTLTGGATSALHSLEQGVGRAGQALTRGGEAVMGTIGGGMDAIQGAAGAVGQEVMAAWNQVKAIAEAIGVTLATYAKIVAQYGVDIVNKVLNGVSALVRAGKLAAQIALNVVMWLLKTGANVTFFLAMLPFTLSIMAWDVFSNAVRQYGIPAAKKALQALAAAYQAGKVAVRDAVNVFWGLLKGSIVWTGEAIKSVGEGVTGVGQAMPDRIASLRRARRQRLLTKNAW
jgi:hypothetical protein